MNFNTDMRTKIRSLSDEHVINELIVALSLDPTGEVAQTWSREVIRRGITEHATRYVEQYERERCRRLSVRR